MGQRKRLGSRRRNVDGNDGVECVCLICGEHLSKHDTDRVTYMEEYHLRRADREGFSPDTKFTARTNGLLPSRRCTNGTALAHDAISDLEARRSVLADQFAEYLRWNRSDVKSN
jgi:hypothetical protein